MIKPNRAVALWALTFVGLSFGQQQMPPDDLTKYGVHATNYQYYLAAVNAVGFSPDGKYLVTATPGATTKFWSLRTGKLTLEAKPGPLGENRIRADFTIAFSKDGKLLASRGKQEQEKPSDVVLIEAATGKIQAVLKGHKDMSSEPVFSPDDSLLATGGRLDEMLILWDMKTLEPRHKIATGGQNGAPAFSPDGSLIVVLNNWHEQIKPGDQKLHRRLLIYDVKTGKQKLRLDDLPYISRAIYSPDGKDLVLGRADGFILYLTPRRERNGSNGTPANFPRASFFRPTARFLPRRILIWASAFGT